MTFVIVLGHRLSSPAIHDELRGRVEEGVAVLEETGAGHLILSGGSRDPEGGVSESEVMRKYALEAGVPGDVILVEDRSTDTLENAVFCRAVVDSLGEREGYVVSSCYHMGRVEYIFGMCFGDGYGLNYDRCHVCEGGEDEVRLLNNVIEFFTGLEKGDIPAIRERMGLNG